MNDSDRKLLTDLLVTQVLCLAAELKAEKERNGVHSTSDYIQEAWNRISSKRERVLSFMSGQSVDG